MRPTHQLVRVGKTIAVRVTVRSLIAGSVVRVQAMVKFPLVGKPIIIPVV